MVTVVTDIRLREGAEQKWDTVMRTRMTAAKDRRAGSQDNFCAWRTSPAGA